MDTVSTIAIVIAVTSTLVLAGAPKLWRALREWFEYHECRHWLRHPFSKKKRDKAGREDVGVWTIYDD